LNYVIKFLHLQGFIKYRKMKKFKLLFYSILFFAFATIIMVSCKRGDGDPFFSLLTRKQRLTGDWKMTSLTSTYSYTNKTFETTYDGNKKKVVYTVHDTNINGENTTYITNQTYTGPILTNYKKDGTYFYSENLQNDTTGLLVNKEVTGNWYFMGANSQEGYKDKELLAMQPTNFSYNPNLGDPYTIIYQGNNMVDVYDIYSLKNKIITIKVNKTETIAFVKYTTIMEYTLEPK
jgi:hypothetical protein